MAVIAEARFQRDGGDRRVGLEQPLAGFAHAVLAQVGRGRDVQCLLEVALKTADGHPGEAREGFDFHRLGEMLANEIERRRKLGEWCGELCGLPKIARHPREADDASALVAQWDF